MELNDVLRLVRGLTSKAEDLGDPNSTAYNPHEALACEAKADALMLKYQIDSVMLDQTRPEAEKIKPGKIEIELGNESDIIGLIGSLASDLAAHCRCRIRKWTRYNYETRVWYAKVYGFDADVQYFQLLYTTTRLHMLGAVIPKPDPALSFQQNCFRLHEAGYNWLDIARMYGWDEKAGVKTKFQAGGEVKRAYYRECGKRGVDPKKISAGGAETFRKSAASGYSDRIRGRIRDVAKLRESGGELLLKGWMDDLDQLYREDNPDLFREHTPVKREPCQKCANSKSGYCRDHPRPRAYRPGPYSEAGYASGVAQANTANLRPGAGVGGPATPIER